MTKASSRRPLRTIADQAVMPGKAGQRDLQHDLARALRPAILLLSLFETFQLTANIDQHARDFRTHRHQRPHHSFLRGDHLVAQQRRV